MLRAPSARPRPPALTLLVLALALLASGIVLAKKNASVKVKEALADARVAIDKRDFGAAIVALDAALTSAREAAPLVIEKAIVVKTPITYQLGVFDPAPGGIIRDGVVRLYLEVANFGIRVIDPETHEIELRLSGSFATADGEDIGTKELGVHSLRTRTPHHVAPVGLEFSLGKNVPRGAYLVDVHVVDAVSKKEAKQRVRFVIER